MCGIAGFIGNFDPASLEAMNTALLHRGPDDHGSLWVESARLGLTHRRLSIIDPSPAGHQPMWDAERRVAIVFNGEIYNYRELREELRAEGFRFQNATDTEVILNLYLRDGPDCVAKLNGIFAFALWDAQKRQLWLARDGVGVKPLYYFVSAEGLAFASEIKALCQLPQLDRTLDPLALAHYLTYLHCPFPRTPFRAVKKALPGHLMLIGVEGKIQETRRFYRLPYDQPIGNLSVREAEEGLIQHLSQAVERQMVADVPVGAFLSGGLDSSAVVTFARPFAREGRLDCFTIGQTDQGATGREGFAEDLPYAQRVAAHLGVKLNTVWMGAEAASAFEQMVYHLDEPVPDPAAWCVFLISQMARQAGCKVLLSGAGGDDLLSGYRRHHAIGLERWWTWLPRPLRTALSRGSASLPQDRPWSRRLGKLFRYADKAAAERLAGYFVWTERGQVMRLFTPSYRAEVSQHNLLSPLLDALRDLPPGTDPLNQMLYLDGQHFLTDHNLNYTDKMSMAAGVEVRVPFLDPDLVRFAAALPPHYKQHGATGKWIFKRAMEPYLPRDVIYRPKTGFGMPVRTWLKRELRPLVNEVLSADTLRRRGVFDPAAVAELVQSSRQGKVDADYAILGLVCMETWFRLFLDQKPPAPAGRAETVQIMSTGSAKPWTIGF